MTAPASTIARTGSFLVRATAPSIRKNVPSTATASYTTAAAPRSIAKEVCTKARYLKSISSLHNPLVRRFAGSDRTTVRCLSGLSGSGANGDRAGQNKWGVPERSSNTTNTTTMDSSPSRPASAPAPLRISLGGGSWDSIKDDINEELINPSEDSQANIAANLKKLAAISKGTSSRDLIERKKPAGMRKLRHYSLLTLATAFPLSTHHLQCSSGNRHIPHT